MIELYDGGVYLLNGTELVADNGEAAAAIEAKTGKKVDIWLVNWMNLC